VNNSSITQFLDEAEVEISSFVVVKNAARFIRQGSWNINADFDQTFHGQWIPVVRKRVTRDVVAFEQAFDDRSFAVGPDFRYDARGSLIHKS